tara:strand:+ start:1521 stop:2768 length:1248 start_codon:yes stop_codon:yes gene_type:complete
MALITSVNINNTTLRTGATSLPVQVVGDSDAIFSVQVTRSSDSRFYDFTTETFAAATTSQSRLKNQSPGTFNLAIPAAASGDTYTIIVMAEPHYNTKLSMGNGIRYATTVTQKGNAIITFAALGTGLLASTAIGTSTGSVVDSFSTPGSPTVVMSDLQLTVTTSASDYGFFITTTKSDIDLNNGTWNSGALYWSTTETVDGTTSGSTSVVVDDLSNLVVGMELISSTGGGDSIGTDAEITAIDTDTKTLTLSAASSLTNNATMTFRAYGPRLIRNAIGIGLSLRNPTVRLGQTTTTVRTELTSDIAEGADIAVNGTLGISKGATIRMRGVKKDSESGACIVGGVGGSTTAGSFLLTNGEIEASSDRPVRVGTKIYIDGSSNKIYLSGTIAINKYPEANQNIYIDTTKILTTGTAS